MKKIITILCTAIIMVLIGGSVTQAQDDLREDKKERKSFVKNLDKIRLLHPTQIQAMKSVTDNDIDTWIEEYWTGEEWADEMRATYEYNSSRTEITVSLEYFDGTEWVNEGSETLIMDANGYPLELSFTFGDNSFEETFHYNESGRLDSLTYSEEWDSVSATGKTELIYVTEDSVRLIDTYTENGEMIEENLGYFVNRDGNFIEGFEEESEESGRYLDRYTNYNTSFDEFLRNIFNEFFFVESYNDEYYFDTEEWVPYGRTTLVEENGVVTEILDEYYYAEEGWVEEYNKVLTYTDGNITQELEQYYFGPELGWEDEFRTTYSYGGVVSNEEVQLADGFQLHQNYPNPFNPTTQISYSIPVASEISLDVYNVLGSKVSTLVQGRKSAGEHVTTFDASNLPSGIYYYKLQYAGSVEVRSMMLIK